MTIYIVMAATIALFMIAAFLGIWQKLETIREKIESTVCQKQAIESLYEVINEQKTALEAWQREQQKEREQFENLMKFSGERQKSDMGE